MMSAFFEAVHTLYGLEIEPPPQGWTVDASYQLCKRLTHAHYENFPVGSLLIPKRLRHHVHAIYAFARVSDDFSDEAYYEGQRMERLDEWEHLLKECYQDRADHPIFIALAESVKELSLPMYLLQDLLTAFKMDVTVSRYESWEQLLAYCRYSANPVGRLILWLFAYRDDERLHQSDCICTALQLANHWQDAAIDLKKPRIYIPLEDMKEYNYSEEDLFNHVYDERYVRLMKRQAVRAWLLFDEGYPLLESVHFPLSMELRITWLGGAAILHRTAQCNFDVFNQRPKLSKFDFMKLAARSMFRIRGKRTQLQRYFNSL